MADPFPRDTHQHRQSVIDQFGGAGLDDKAQALFKASSAHDAGRILDKAQAVKYPDQAVPEILLAAEKVEQLPIVTRI